ncbi:MAG: RNA methyltransferase [Spirochaetaceae bacterium]|nr:RNA methyltransferase [Spirochaetaceae bacterium]
MNAVESLPFTVVLCRVREAGNLGSICRAMKTMGITRLFLADCPEYDEDIVRMMAVHAFDVYQGAERFDTLHDALLGAALSAGFSRRMGARRKSHSYPLREFAESMASSSQSPVCIVFGNERDGLSDAELAECTLAVYIPTSDAFPSLNVAQAVQIACYEIHMARTGKNPQSVPSEPAGTGSVNSESALCPAGESGPATRSFVEAETGKIIGLFQDLGFFRKSGSSYTSHFLRDLCERAALAPSEVAYLRRIIEKTAALADRKKDS